MERHLHFNLLTGLWLWLFLVVFANLMKFLLNRFPIPGLTELSNNVF